MSDKLHGKIYFIPSSLGEGGESSIPGITREVISSLRFFIVENERSARRFLRAVGYKVNFDEVVMKKAERDEDFIIEEDMIGYLHGGKDIGVLSEAGSPAIADPGAAVARWAHSNGIRVVPLSGPSSILLALVASGLNGQHFAFHGYLPVSQHERKVRLKQLEEESAKKSQTQIFMETPYRNDSLLNDIIKTCRSTTLLCLASNITLNDESISTRCIADWKRGIPDLKKKPTIFLLMAEW